VTARDAQLKQRPARTEVAYFHNGKVHTSSFVSEGTGENAKEDGNKTQALNAVLFQIGDKPGQQAAAKADRDRAVSLRARLARVRAVAAPLYGNAFDKTSGVVC